MSKKKAKKDQEAKENAAETAEKILDQQEENAEKSDSNELEDELQKAKDKHLRLFAEFENYKKRTARERIELIGRSTEELMTALIPVIDDFDRAKKSMDEAPSIEGIKEGIDLIYNKFKKTLEQKGLKEMESSIGQPLDTDLHEAITQIPAPEDNLKGKVVDELEKGYTLNDRVIRFAKVVVGQ